MICVRYFELALKTVLLAALSLPWVSHAAAMDIEDGWIRAVPPVSSTTAGYLILHNRGDTDRTLTAVSSPVAGAGEVHDMSPQEDGTRHMHHLPELVVPAGEAVVLKPGGKHLMLYQLQRPLEIGEQIEVCLAFAEGEPVCGPFEVRAP